MLLERNYIKCSYYLRLKRCYFYYYYYFFSSRNNVAQSFFFPKKFILDAIEAGSEF